MNSLVRRLFGRLRAIAPGLLSVPIAIEESPCGPPVAVPAVGAGDAAAKPTDVFLSVNARAMNEARPVQVASLGPDFTGKIALEVADARPFSVAELSGLGDPELHGLLQSLSNEQLLATAHSLWQLRPLGPRPGWCFGCDENNPDPLVHLRLAIWRVCHARQMQTPICVPWYDGSKLNLHLGNDLSYPTFIGGCIEPNEFAFVSSFLKPGMVFLDIGANEGFYSIFASQRVGKSGKVVAFEPSLRELERLQANITLNQATNIRPEGVALAEVRGQGELRICEFGHEGQNTLGDFAHNVRQGGTQAVEIRSLDDYLEQNPVDRLDFIKIDVEGAEQRVLEGARRTLAEYSPVLLLELNDKALRFQGANCESITKFLQTVGYAIYNFSSSTGLPVAADDSRFSDNIAAIPSNSSP